VWVETDAACEVEVRAGGAAAVERTFEVEGHHYAIVRVGGLPENAATPYQVALDGDTVWLVVDEKPKRRRDIQRLANVRSEPRVSLIVDRYDEDWATLWWVRADGTARLVGAGPDYERAIALLRAKYPQYEVWAPIGPAIVVTVDAWRGWSGAVAAPQDSA
jgi:PPOX class probable F420-dependent enzyme